MSNLSGFVKRIRDIMRNDAGINGDAQRIEQIAWMLFLKVYDTKEQDWEWDDENYESWWLYYQLAERVEKAGQNY